MSEMLTKIGQYGSLIVGAVVGILMLLLHLKQRRLRNLEIKLLKDKQSSELSPLEAQLDKAHEISEEARKAYEAARDKLTDDK